VLVVGRQCEARIEHIGALKEADVVVGECRLVAMREADTRRCCPQFAKLLIISQPHAIGPWRQPWQFERTIHIVDDAITAEVELDVAILAIHVAELTRNHEVGQKKKLPLGLDAFDCGVGGVPYDLADAKRSGQVDLALQVLHAIVEGRQVDPVAPELLLGAEFETVLGLLIEWPRRHSGIGVAQIISAAAEPARVKAINLRVVIRLPLKADFRRNPSPFCRVGEIGCTDQRV